MFTISVIIPIYNVEKYLRQCLDSVLASGEENLEIIAINDGSTDHSYEILKSYSDPRLKIFTKENEGLYKTWKFGVSQANGDYIMFVDSDDFIEPELFHVVNDCLKENNYDLVQFGYYYLYYEDKEFKREREFNLKEGVYVSDSLLKIKSQLISKYDSVDFPGTRWSKVFKTTKFKEFLKYSLDDIADYEDASVTFPYASLIECLRVIKQPYYYYRIRRNSISHDIKKIESSYCDCKKICHYFESIKKDVGFTESMLNEMYLRNFVVVYERAIQAKQYRLANEIYNDSHFKLLLNQHNFHNKIKGLLLKYRCYRLYNFLLKIKSHN